MSAIARSTPIASGATMLGQVVDGGTTPPQVMVDGSDTAADAYPMGTYQPVTGDRVVLKKVGRQLAISGTFWDPLSATGQQPSAWIRTKSAAAIALTSNTWLETGPDTTEDGGAAGQITRSGANLVIPATGYYMFIVRVGFPTLAAATRLLVGPDLAGYGSTGTTELQRTDVVYQAAGGPVVASHPIPQLYTAGDLVSAYLFSSATLTVAANQLRMYGWRVS